MYKEFLFHLPNDIGKLMQLAAEIRQLKEYGDLSPKTQYVLDLALVTTNRAPGRSKSRWGSIRRTCGWY